MENIGFFLTFCDEIGVPKSDIFQTVDLYENQNIPGVSGDFCWRAGCVIIFAPGLTKAQRRDLQKSKGFSSYSFFNSLLKKKILYYL